jgi:hypothetical protein
MLTLILVGEGGGSLNPFVRFMRKAKKEFLQWLKPICFGDFTPGLKPRPPKEKRFSGSVIGGCGDVFTGRVARGAAPGGE